MRHETKPTLEISRGKDDHTVATGTVSVRVGKKKSSRPTVPWCQQMTTYCPQPGANRHQSTASCCRLTWDLSCWNLPHKYLFLKWSGCIVRIRLWPRLPHGCHRLLSIRRRSALPQCELCPEVSPRSCSCYPCCLLASTGLCVHPGQWSLPSCAAWTAGPILPHLVGL